MKSSVNLVKLVETFEGLKLTAYLCPANVWTIGLGSTFYPNGQKVKQGDVLTKEQAYQLFKDTLGKYESAVTRNVTSALNQNQFDALVDFCYNLGDGNFKASTLLKKINANPTDPSIRAEFLRWNKAGGTVLNGLTKRRTAEADLYGRGE